jgi:glyceraldehyde 3-phosphate dehydrogenase
MTIRVGINGFGRIGMLTTKALMRSGEIEVVAVNDVMPMESLSLLFERDSTHGIWHEDVSFDGNILRI